MVMETTYQLPQPQLYSVKGSINRTDYCGKDNYTLDLDVIEAYGSLCKPICEGHPDIVTDVEIEVTSYSEYDVKAVAIEALARSYDHAQWDDHNDYVVECLGDVPIVPQDRIMRELGMPRFEGFN